jgi:hypothetical protein
MMEATWLKSANLFFYVFHVAVILFNLFGWIPYRLRRWNLLVLGLTAFSWFVLGIFYGFGYCFLTDWHWQVRERLGYPVESGSYIHFLITSLLGVNVSVKLVDWLTLILFFVALTVSVILNVLDWRRARGKSRPN